MNRFEAGFVRFRVFTCRSGATLQKQQYNQNRNSHFLISTNIVFQSSNYLLGLSQISYDDIWQLAEGGLSGHQPVRLPLLFVYKISTYPSVPCTRIRCPSFINFVAFSTPTTAGKPYSRAITAP